MDKNKLYSLEDIQRLIEKGAEYEQLEKHGRLVRLPCPLETMVYRVVPDCKRCTIVEDPEKCRSKLRKNCVKKVMPCVFTIDLLPEFGKTVFATESEAVVALVS